MQDANAGGRVSGSQVPAAMLVSVSELNHRFLDLIGSRPRRWDLDNRVGLSAELCGQIAPLSDAQKKAAADCPYALFDLRFQDEYYWQSRLRGAGSWSVADLPAGDDDCVTFVRLAIFFAWHVAATGKLAARLLLGMSDATSGAFREATIGCLPALVAVESANLTARWSGNPAYWRALSRAASHTNSAALRRVQLHGLQLAAAARLA